MWEWSCFHILVRHEIQSRTLVLVWDTSSRLLGSKNPAYRFMKLRILHAWKVTVISAVVKDTILIFC